MDTPIQLADLHIKIFADGAGRSDILEMAEVPYIHGFTTNPSLLSQAGVTDYAAFASDILAHIPTKPISFEVLSDTLSEMEHQARTIATWGGNVYVKIPITNTEGVSTAPIVRSLSASGIPLNITAILTAEQVAVAAEALHPKTPSIVSVFAGRIADTGRNPLPIMQASKNLLRELPRAELLWASCRETYNIYEAEELGVDIITVPYSVIHKLRDVGLDLTEYSLAGIRAFYDASKKAGLTV
jgi:transaldolase